MFNGLKSEKRKTNLCVNSEKGAQTNVMCGAHVFIKVRKVKHSQVTMWKNGSRIMNNHYAVTTIKNCMENTKFDSIQQTQHM